MYLSDLRVYFRVTWSGGVLKPQKKLVDYANTTNVEFIVDPKVLFHGSLIYSYLHLSCSSDCHGRVQIGSLSSLWHDHIAFIDDTACRGRKTACAEPWTCPCKIPARCSYYSEGRVSSSGRSGAVSSKYGKLFTSKKNVFFFKKVRYRAFSLTWPASMQIYRNNRKYLHKKKIHLSQDTNMDVVSNLLHREWRKSYYFTQSQLTQISQRTNKNSDQIRVSGK